jgi:hypothetical protein
MYCKHKVVVPIEVTSKLQLLICADCGAELGRIVQESINISVKETNPYNQDELEIMDILYPNRVVEGPVRPLTKKEKEQLK